MIPARPTRPEWRQKRPITSPNLEKTWHHAYESLKGCEANTQISQDSTCPRHTPTLHSNHEHEMPQFWGIWTGDPQRLFQVGKYMCCTRFEGATAEGRNGSFHEQRLSNRARSLLAIGVKEGNETACWGSNSPPVCLDKLSSMHTCTDSRMLPRVVYIRTQADPAVSHSVLRKSSESEVSLAQRLPR